MNRKEIHENGIKESWQNIYWSLYELPWFQIEQEAPKDVKDALKLIKDYASRQF